MRLVFASSLLPLAVSVGALQVTQPEKGAEIDPSSSFTVKWDSVSTDPSSFNLYLVNNAVYPSVEKKIASDVDTSDGSYTVDGISGLENTGGYQINLFSNSEHNSGILAQSEQFNVSAAESTSSSTTSSVSATSTSTSTATTSTSVSRTSSESESTTSTSTVTSSALVSTTTTAEPESTSATSSSSSFSSSSSSASPTAASSNATTSATDTPDDLNAGVTTGAPLTVLAGLVGGALLFTL
ncbi:Ser-Thr-rich glycosyl-phosphatidyl-inositol-anchored membrane family-domain-containing protein [Aspergillus egyptiacus]|nr:Ser-Thr-rich glycosyl-phosphatidyl-inositol-anchored membrane family-domain-containing protein [Aspergillus egyptiacus]